MVFEWIVDPKVPSGGRAAPKTPRDSSGRPRRIDGRKILSLHQAAEKTGATLEALRRDWLDTFAGMLGADAHAFISESKWRGAPLSRREQLVEVSDRVAVLAGIVGELKQDLQDVIAGKDLPRPQMIWRRQGGKYWPLHPRSPFGRPVVPDGRTYFSLTEAAAKLRKPAELLRRQWLQTFGGMLGDDGAVVRAAAAVEVANA